MSVPRLTDILTRDELAQLTRTSNWRAAWTVAANWGLIAIAFALAIRWPLLAPLSVLILAGRQLGLGIIVHDCAHHALFEDRITNERVGQWLAGTPMNQSLARYRSYHLKHHRHAGTPDDPDIGFVKSYPVERASLRRKFARDLTGRTGLRDLRLSLRRWSWREQGLWLAFHVLLLTACCAAGGAARGIFAYALWWVAYLFVYPAIVRLRQIGEHGVARDRTSLDPRENTSTTLARPWERLFVAPNHVHYHLEHHFAAGVPPYRLAAMHRMLAARGFYDGFTCIRRGYGDVIRGALRAA